MSDIDIFSSQLLEQAKRFFEKAKDEKTHNGKIAYLNASILIAVSSLEAHINAVAEEIIEVTPDLEILEKSLLLEKEFKIDNGRIILTDQLKMYRLIERIEFIVGKFGKFSKIDKQAPYWTKMVDALKMRNSLVHPKSEFEISESIVKAGLEGIIGFLNDFYKCLYNSSHPAFGRLLDSNLNF